ncbi:LytR family transcriptional regulator [Bacillus sp. REN16]|uniref:polyisoprenyl-teichoic acid--peptidoglycan teichoic acid transferase TagU n=1 Tax=Bacillus sp. REN16 TaxID=2887296 RepID=UPI001E4C0010|nr:LytR family transcriptional regulator [Bacillus sp. REN16]MCC3356081.1 LytR family transcriptional regulator [Bacillus sp. REN16]
MENRHKKKMSIGKKILISVLSIFIVLILGAGGYAYYLYNSVEKTAETMHKPIDREKSEKRTEEVVFEKHDPISVLLMGVDARAGDRGRSDSLIVLTVNPNDKSMKMVSIPRDTRTEIVGKGFQDKINHAYAFGGPEMAIDTVENFLDIPIDYYVQVNMESFKDIVDAVGGVTVNNSFEFSSGGYTFSKGQVYLNGAQALAYARMRYEDPRGDFGRQDRQRQIMMAVINKGASFSSLTNFKNILGAIGKNIQTNLTFDQMVDIQKNYKEARHSLEQSMVKGSGTKIDGIYYYIVPDSERSSLSSMLKEHLLVSETVTKK